MKLDGSELSWKNAFIDGFYKPQNRMHIVVQVQLHLNTIENNEYPQFRQRCQTLPLIIQKRKVR